MEKISFEKLETRLKPRAAEKGIYRYSQSVAKEICDYLGDAEYEEFGLWMGKIKHCGIERVVGAFRNVKEKGLRSNRYLLASLRKKQARESA